MHINVVIHFSQNLFTFVQFKVFVIVNFKIFFVCEYVLECLVTLCALEWLFHVGPLMFFQVASYWEDLVIL